MIHFGVLFDDLLKLQNYETIFFNTSDFNLNIFY